MANTFVPALQASSTSALPVSSDTGKKALATLLIVMLSLCVISVPYGLTPKNLTQAICDLIAVLLLVIALVFSIGWRIKLAGYINTSGRQAVAVFFIVFCAWGFALVVMSATRSHGDPLTAIPLTMAALYVLGFYACTHWLRKLRRSEQGQTIQREAEGAGGASPV
ncbi:MAG TPA: hypothetical protein VFK06_00325 [Candidatus Angelobacter sp.]|nr:hypothetical protein [Candidatus Angelobacter sp.]